MKDFYNYINAICFGNLGLDVKIFPNVQFNPLLNDKVLFGIFSPEYPTAEPNGFFKRMDY
jgi:hypothetical protein